MSVDAEGKSDGNMEVVVKNLLERMKAIFQMGQCAPVEGSWCSRMT